MDRDIRQILARGQRDAPGQPGITPGGVLVYGDQGADVDTIAFGRSHIVVPDSAAPPVFEVTADTVYDIASITKPVATAGVLMKLAPDLDEPVSRWMPELCGDGKDRITLAHLLGHASGFPAHQPYYERLLGSAPGLAPEHARPAGASESRREALLRMVCDTALASPPGTQAVYSDLGYIVLGFVIERMTGKRIDVAARELVTGPLGMTSTFFVDLAAPRRALPATVRVAPTEVCPYRGLVCGEVHDDNAHAGGGVHGHAGLFATAGDLARFARSMVSAAAGVRLPGGADPDVVARFLGRSSAPDTTWRLGWDRPSPPPALSHAGSLWPRDGAGHLGFTGCSMWLDPPRGRYVILLTNRVHPSRDQPAGQPGIRELRAAVMDAVVRRLAAR